MEAENHRVTTFIHSPSLPKTKIALENGWLEDENSFWDGLFSGAMLVSGRVSGPFRRLNIKLQECVASVDCYLKMLVVRNRAVYQTAQNGFLSPCCLDSTKYLYTKTKHSAGVIMK